MSSTRISPQWAIGGWRRRAAIVLALLAPAATLTGFTATGADAAPAPAVVDDSTGTGPLRPPAAGVNRAKPGARMAPALTGADLARAKRQDALLPAAQSLAEQARVAGSDIGGIQLDVASGTVHVYRTDPNRPLGLTKALPDGMSVVVHQARFTRTAMLEAANAVTRDAKLLGEQRVRVQAVGPSVDGSGITVSVLVGDSPDKEVAQATDVLRRQYGDIVGKVTGLAHQTSKDDLYFDGWRFNDFAPWYGGDRIDSGSSGCTTGFSALYNGAPAMLTAAHCGGVGTNFWNGPTTTGGWNFMGTSVYSDGGTDVGAISVTSTTSTINVGPAENSSLLYIGAWGSPFVGQYLCQSGSYTGEVCGLYVVDTAQYVCLSWFLWWCTFWQGPLADVINTAGSAWPAAGHGDSGGPVYQHNGSSGTATGLVHGQLTPNAAAAYPAYFPDNLWCWEPRFWSQRCSSGFSFAHMPGY